MDIQEAYNFWSETYDSDTNLTRDLDKTVAQTVLKDFVDLKVLEFGCGSGKHSEWLAKQSKSVLAMDFSAGMLNKARANVTAANVTFIRHDITKPWPAEDQAFELVVGTLVLEHIESLQPVFSQAYRILKPSGRLFVCELHPYRQLQGTQAKFVPGGGGEEEITAFIHDISEYINVAVQAGFSLEQINEWRDTPTVPLTDIPRLVSFVFNK